MAYQNLILLDKIKTLLKVSGDSLDDTLSDVIEWVSDAIQEYVGQPIAQASVQWQFDGDGSDRVMLPYAPVAACTKLESRSDAIGSTYTDVAGTFDVREQGGVYYLRYGQFVDGHQYQATVAVGYDTVPGDVVMIAYEMVASLIRESELPGIGKGRGGLESLTETDSHGGVARAWKILNSRTAWMERLDRYRFIHL